MKRREFLKLSLGTAALAALSREEAIAQSLRELEEFFPAVKEAKLEKAALIKEVRATFGVPPGIDAARPDSGIAAPLPAPWLRFPRSPPQRVAGRLSVIRLAGSSAHAAAFRGPAVVSRRRLGR